MKIKRTPEERALRSAYTKARDIAHKRITRLMKKYGKEEVQTRLLHDDSDIAREYNRIQKFLSSENSRLPSYNKPIYDAKKQAALDKFHEYGYDFVTMDNLDTVISYLEELKDRKDAEEYDSTQIIDIAVQAFEYKISPTKMKSGFIDYEKTQTKIEKRLNKLEKQGKDTALSSQNFRDRWL